MGMKISDFNKKLLICSLGILLLTYGICFFYKRNTLKEGLLLMPDDLAGILGVSVLPPVTSSTAGLTALIIGASTENSALQKAIDIKHGVIANKNATDAEFKRRKYAAENGSKIKKTEKNVEEKVGKAKEEVKVKIGDEGKKCKKQVTDTEKKLEKKIDKVEKERARKEKARSIMNKFSYFRIMAIVGIIYQWGLPFAQCGWYWFVNIKQCFFWYLLDIIGNILYLPFGILLWFLPILEQPADLFWNTLDDLDCMVFDITGYHFMHYSPTIIKNCYSCSPAEFPKIDISDLFQVI